MGALTYKECKLLNFRIKKWNLSQASVAALDFVACQSKKMANTSMLYNKFLCSPSSRTIIPSFFEPQASQPSVAQPSVMDIRRLLALASDKRERGDAIKR